MADKVFRVQAEGDVMYIRARTRELAEAALFAVTGPMPASLLKWSGPVDLPEGEEVLNPA